MESNVQRYNNCAASVNFHKAWHKQQKPTGEFNLQSLQQAEDGGLPLPSYPAQQLEPGVKPWKHHRGVPVGQDTPASWPSSTTEALAGGTGAEETELRTLPLPPEPRPLQPDWHPRSPPRANYPAKRRMISPKVFEAIREILDQMETEQEREQEAEEEEVLEGSRGSLPAPAEEMEVPPGSPTSGPARANDAAEEEKISHKAFEALRKLVDNLEREQDMANERSANGDGVRGTQRPPCAENVLKRCMIATASIVVSVPVTILLCLLVRWRQKKKKQKKAGAAGAQGWQRTRGQPESQNQRKAPQLSSLLTQP
ncbi:uncharacterized protein LOC135179394 [Pogoniulus pusillus]|uniref:uncharacterized protein LOC135179394 n=1 Tax=Pogoniulus pusillus TaxID=488313 RepID=UPI0030B936B3